MKTKRRVSKFSQGTKSASTIGPAYNGISEIRHNCL